MEVYLLLFVCNATALSMICSKQIKVAMIVKGVAAVTVAVRLASSTTGLFCPQPEDEAIFTTCAIFLHSKAAEKLLQANISA